MPLALMISFQYILDNAGLRGYRLLHVPSWNTYFFGVTNIVVTGLCSL